MKPPSNRFIIHADPGLTKSNKIRFRVEVVTPEGYTFEIKGCLAGARADGELFALPPFLPYRPFVWNDKFEADILGLLQKRGTLKRLKAKATWAAAGKEEVLEL